MNREAVIIGAGLAGSEAAYQLAERGIKVKLYEMRPIKSTEAHKTENFAELVCSNSLGGDHLGNASGLMKEELRRMGSLLVKIADETRVPAGQALAVDREGFSGKITEILKNHPNIEIINEEVTEIPQDKIVLIASGPLTSEVLSKKIQELTHADYLYFYDAAAPIVTLESIDKDKVYFQSRYDKGDGEYINCPMNEEEYKNINENLITNLPDIEFDMDDLKELYHLRWAQENAYRDLKYPLCLKAFHSKKYTYIVQEVFARAIMHNYCAAISQHIELPDRSRKLQYQVNFSEAVKICRDDLRSRTKNNAINIESLIANNIEAIRPNRTFRRQARFKLPMSFCYR